MCHTPNSSTLSANYQPNTCNCKCFSIQNNEIGNHALPNLLPPPTLHPTQVESAAESPALILASGPRPVSRSRAAQGRGARSAQRLPLLSSHGPLATIWPSSVRRPPRPPAKLYPEEAAGVCPSWPSSGPSSCCLAAAVGRRRSGCRPHTGLPAQVHFLTVEPGGGGRACSLAVSVL